MNNFYKLLLTLGFIYALISLFVAFVVMRPIAKHINISPLFIDSNYKKVSFSTTDDIKLYGWLFRPESKKVIMFVPGVLDNRTNQGYYGVVLAKELIDKGYCVLMFDPRGKGDSEGKVKSKDEKMDVEAAFNFLKSQGFESKSIAILADSSGATSTLMSLKEIKGVGVVILDSTPLNYRQVFNHSLTKEFSIPYLFLPGIHFFLNFAYGFDIKDLVQINRDDVASNSAFLILHTRHDQSVPFKNSELIKDKIGKMATLVIFPHGSHIESFKFNPKMYRKEVFNFLDTHLN